MILLVLYFLIVRQSQRSPQPAVSILDYRGKIFLVFYPNSTNYDHCQPCCWERVLLPALRDPGDSLLHSSWMALSAAPLVAPPRSDLCPADYSRSTLCKISRVLALRSSPPFVFPSELSLSPSFSIWLFSSLLLSSSSLCVARKLCKHCKLGQSHSSPRLFSISYGSSSFVV